MTSGYHFTLSTVRTKSVSFSLRPQTPETDTSVELDIHPVMTIVFHEIGTNTIEVDLRFELSESKLPFTLQVITSGTFIFQKTPEKDLLRQLININCASIIFPFLREQVADLTRRAGFPPLLLPPTNFVAMFEEQNQQPPSAERQVMKPEKRVSGRPRSVRSRVPVSSRQTRTTKGKS